MEKDKYQDKAYLYRRCPYCGYYPYWKEHNCKPAKKKDPTFEGVRIDIGFRMLGRAGDYD